MPSRKMVDKEYQDLINVDIQALKENIQIFFPDLLDPRMPSRSLYPS
jgi:hypothetical protein